jgi:hypothetical protein
MTRRFALCTSLLTLLACNKERIDLVSALDGGANDAGAALIPASSTSVRVGWLSPQGIAALPAHYGLQIQNGSNPERFGVPGAPLYKQNLLFMKPGLANLHSVNLMSDSTTDATGWLASPTTQAFAWDREKIRRSLQGNEQLAAPLMLTIPRWPQALGAPNAALPPANYDKFAQLCADLVRVVNVEQQRGVRAFQILSEMDGLFDNDGGIQLGKLISTVSRAMKLVDPNILVGGAGFVYGGAPLIEGFISSAGESLDFVSFHGYGTGDVNAPLATVFANADNLGSYADVIRMWAAGRTRPLGIYQTQWSLNWREDSRMAGQDAAVFDTLAMISFVKFRLTGATGWKDADGWYGKLDEQDRLRPSAHAMSLMNRAFVGDVVATTSPNASVTAFAVRNAGKRSLLLVNRSAATLQIPVEIWNGEPLSNNTKRSLIDSNGATELDATLAKGQRSFTVPLPAISITAFED